MASLQSLKTAQDRFDEYVERNLTVSLAYEMNCSSKGKITDFLNITKQKAKQALKAIHQSFLAVRINSNIKSLKKKIKNNKTKIKKDSDEWTCFAKLKSSKSHSYNFRCRRSSYLSNLHKFIDADPKILKAVVLIARVSKKELTSTRHGEKKFFEAEDRICLDIFDLNTINLKIPILNENLEFTDEFFNEFEISDPGLSFITNNLDYSENFKESSRSNNFSNRCNHISFYDKEFFDDVMSTPDDISESSVIASLNRREISLLLKMLQKGYDTRKKNVYKYYGIGPDLRRNKRSYDSANFDVPDFHSNEAAINFMSEAIPFLTIAEMLIIYTHSQCRFKAPPRLIKIKNSSNNLHNLQVIIKNNIRIESPKNSLESLVSIALHYQSGAI